MGESYRWFPVQTALIASRTSIVALAGAVLLGACGATPEASEPQPAAPRAEVGTKQGPPAQPSYTVNVELPPQTVRGQEAIARVRVQPNAPWHMNLEYPAKLRLKSSDSVELDTNLLHKTDAERFDGDALVFSVLFTPQAKGNHAIDAEVDFAVCGDAACGPVTEAVQLAFEVGCREEDSGLC